MEKDVDMLHVKVKKVRGGGDGGDRRSGDQTLRPLDVPAQIRQLHVASDQQGSSQVEAAPGIGTNQLVVFVESITEHLVQP